MQHGEIELDACGTLLPPQRVASQFPGCLRIYVGFVGFMSDEILFCHLGLYITPAPSVLHFWL